MDTDSSLFVDTGEEGWERRDCPLAGGAQGDVISLKASCQFDLSVTTDGIGKLVALRDP
jgi:hypothetical protein